MPTKECSSESGWWSLWTLAATKIEVHRQPVQGPFAAGDSHHAQATRCWTGFAGSGVARLPGLQTAIVQDEHFARIHLSGALPELVHRPRSLRPWLGEFHKPRALGVHVATEGDLLCGSRLYRMFLLAACRSPCGRPLAQGLLAASPCRCVLLMIFVEGLAIRDPGCESGFLKLRASA
jgi:hypothetical protein